MAELNKVKSFSAEEMQEYCKEHIDRYKVEPIIREAFHQGLISPDVAYVYLRIAQMEEGKEKVSCSQIALEAGLSPAAITLYKKNPLIGISQKTFIQLLVKTHLWDLQDMCEHNNFIEVLTAYVNKYRRMMISHGKDEDMQKADYILKREKDISKDVCRKVYDELVQSRSRGRDTVKLSKVAVLKAEVIEKAEKVKILISVENAERADTIIESSKSSMVHELATKLRQIIGGLLSGVDGYENVYLLGTDNRKICHTMECIALGNERVFLL